MGIERCQMPCPIIDAIAFLGMLLLGSSSGPVRGQSKNCERGGIDSLCTVVFGKPVSVCGEMAGDPAAAILLLGMRMHALSVNASNVPRIKWVLRRQVLRQALRLDSREAIRDLSTRALEEAVWTSWSGAGARARLRVCEEFSCSRYSCSGEGGDTGATRLFTCRLSSCRIMK